MEMSDDEVRFLRETAEAREEYEAEMKKAHDRLEFLARPIRQRRNRDIQALDPDDPQFPQKRAGILRQAERDMKPLEESYRAETIPIKARYETATRPARERLEDARNGIGSGKLKLSPSELAMRYQRRMKR